MTTHLVPRISRKHEHFVFGVIQSGLTAGIASGVANGHLIKEGTFVLNWIGSWLTSWAVMVPVVLFAAPAIRRIVTSMTYD
ncbi:putative membrane protein [Bradyrhizobium sp. AZCC 1577]|uniref:DUF2798 domain-containing protein n=1 Tax=Bradyrhizobium sp. AZCC 1577 TaxID=3117019 RepID=UPI002FF3EE89